MNADGLTRGALLRQDKVVSFGTREQGDDNVNPSGAPLTYFILQPIAAARTRNEAADRQKPYILIMGET